MDTVAVIVIVVILVIAVLIYNAGRKSGKREGSRKGYGVGFSRGRHFRAKSGCPFLLLAIGLLLSIIVTVVHAFS